MYLIVGAGGFLGGYLVKNILQLTDDKVIATYHSSKGLEGSKRVRWVHLDVTDSLSVESLSKIIKDCKERGDKIKCIYTAGYIKPDDCLKNPEVAVKNNILALVNFLMKFGSLFDSFVFTSTDFVFDESDDKLPYKEEDMECPINFYGTIKLTCERIVRSHGFVVVRLPFMFGRSLNPNKSHFIEHVERTIHEKETFEILSDNYENSLDYGSVAQILISLVEKFNGDIPEPIVHICGDKPVTKYEIALAFAREHNLDERYLKPIKLSENTFFLAKRGTIKLDNSLVKKLLNLDKIEFKVG